MLAVDFVQFVYCYQYPSRGTISNGGDLMPIKSDAQRRAVAKYNAANYEQIQVRVPKGYKEEVKAAADARGESVNAYILQAVRDRMNKETPPE